MVSTTSSRLRASYSPHHTSPTTLSPIICICERPPWRPTTTPIGLLARLCTHSPRTSPIKLSAADGKECSKIPRLSLVRPERCELTRPGGAGVLSLPRTTIWAGWAIYRRSIRALFPYGRGGCGRPDAGRHRSARWSRSCVAGFRKGWWQPTEKSSDHNDA
jgi:hypothetical protein